MSSNLDECRSQYDITVNKLMEVDNDVSHSEAMLDVYKDKKNTYRIQDDYE